MEDKIKTYRVILEDAGVDKGEVEDCMAWAFGEDWKELVPSKANGRWNQRHGLLLPLKQDSQVDHGLHKIGLLFLAHVKNQFIRVDMLYDLNESEEKFRALLIKSFAAEGIIDVNEAMDCLSWGLGYDKELLRCHTYYLWPEAFRKNAEIDVTGLDTIEKCIRLLALKWKSKKKLVIARG